MVPSFVTLPVLWNAPPFISPLFVTVPSNLPLLMVPSFVTLPAKVPSVMVSLFFTSPLKMPLEIIPPGLFRFPLYTVALKVPPVIVAYN